MDINKFIEIAKKCNSKEEILKKAKEQAFKINEAEAEKLFLEFHSNTSKLSDDELSNISGGISFDEIKDFINLPVYKKEYYTCVWWKIPFIFEVGDTVRCRRLNVSSFDLNKKYEIHRGTITKRGVAYVFFGIQYDCYTFKSDDTGEVFENLSRDYFIDEQNNK